MKEDYLMKILKTIWSEIVRMWFLIILSILIIVPDDNRWPVLFSLGVLTLTVIVIHLIRKTLFYYVDLQKLMSKAEENPIASAIVFAAVIYILVVLGQSVLLFLKP